MWYAHERRSFSRLPDQQYSYDRRYEPGSPGSGDDRDTRRAHGACDRGPCREPDCIETAGLVPAFSIRKIPMAKTFFQDGKWIDNPNAVVVVVCECGNRYIKTRDEQETCLTCLALIRAK